MDGVQCNGEKAVEWRQCARCDGVVEVAKEMGKSLSSHLFSQIFGAAHLVQYLVEGEVATQILENIWWLAEDDRSGEQLLL